jgi:retinol dehydrogenase 12
VLGVVRNQARGKALGAEIKRLGLPGSAEILTADLADRQEVIKLAQAVRQGTDRLDVLINNAGVAKSEWLTTREGFEVMFATNHLAPFLLTNLLLDLLTAAGHARIVNVSSQGHARVREIPWDDLQAERRFNGFGHYALTKLMNILFTRELARRLRATEVTANCLSPGFVKTGLGRDAKGAFGLFLVLSRPWMSSPEKGAATSIYLASSPEVAGVSGKYFRQCSPKEPSQLALDDGAARRLWDVSIELAGLSGNRSALSGVS